jgi:hypothetical protein
MHSTEQEAATARKEMEEAFPESQGHIGQQRKAQSWRRDVVSEEAEPLKGLEGAGTGTEEQPWSSGD